MRRLMTAAVLVAVVAGCMTPQQKAFLANHAEKTNLYVDAVSAGPVALSEAAVTADPNLTPARKAELLETLRRIRERGDDLKADAERIDELWGG